MIDQKTEKLQIKKYEIRLDCEKRLFVKKNYIKSNKNQMSKM